jgi:hypothetical protein
MNPAVRESSLSHSATACGSRCASTGMNPPGHVLSADLPSRRPYLDQWSVQLNELLGKA